jgi:hypothetical protein
LAYHSCPDLSVVDPGCFVFLTKDRVLEGHRNGRTLVLVSTGGATGHVMISTTVGGPLGKSSTYSWIPRLARA